MCIDIDITLISSHRLIVIIKPIYCHNLYKEHCSCIAIPHNIYTVKNGVFQNSCLRCLNVHSSTTPNRVFLKPPFESVTGHPQNTLTIGSESLKGV